jgi:hypothetical protein
MQWPDPQHFFAALSVDRDLGKLGSIAGEHRLQIYAKQVIVHGCLQIAASELLRQLPQESCELASRASRPGGRPRGDQEVVVRDRKAAAGACDQTAASRLPRVVNYPVSWTGGFKMSPQI